MKPETERAFWLGITIGVVITASLWALALYAFADGYTDQVRFDNVDSYGLERGR